MNQKHLSIWLLCTLVSIANATFPMSLLHRQNQIQMQMNRNRFPRWPQVQYVPQQFMNNIKAPPHFIPFRGPPQPFAPQPLLQQQPVVMLPTNQLLVWNQPVNLPLRQSPNAIKDVYKGKSTILNGIVNTIPASGIPPSFITSNQNPHPKPLMVTHKGTPANLLSPTYTRLLNNKKPHNVQTAQTISAAVNTTPLPRVTPRPTPKTTQRPAISYTNHIANVFGAPQALPLTQNFDISNSFDNGPIHTIPAPNLSLLNKPIYVPDQTNTIEFSHNSINNINNRPKATHTYEVTEDIRDDSFRNVNPFPPNSNGQNTQMRNPQPAKNTIAQPSQIQAQAHIPLSSQELIRLLSATPSQQQLSDTYNLPLSHQPQLQQHFLRNTYKPHFSQPPNTISYPTVQASPVANFNSNVPFNSEQRYAAQYLKSFNFQPNYETFNYVEPQHPSASQTVETIQQLVPEESKTHHNVARNTQEGSFQGFGEVFNATNSIDNLSSASANKESEFMPVEPRFYANMDDLMTSSSRNKEYFASLSSNDMVNTLATLQAAGNLMNIAKVANPRAKSVINLNPYALKNPMMQQSSKNFAASVSNYHNRDTPVRIYIPEQYDDIEVQPSGSIEVKTSMAADNHPNNKYDNDYYYKYMETFDNNTVTESTPEIYVTPLPEDMSPADDVIVSIKKNISAPTLDILTKDWKTSIVIKSQGEVDLKNEYSDFGNKINNRSKRQ